MTSNLDHAAAPAELIKAAGLRITDSRKAVVEALRAHPHASADELFQQVTIAVPQTSLQSVYNALTDFVERRKRELNAAGG